MATGQGVENARRAEAVERTKAAAIEEEPRRRMTKSGMLLAVVVGMLLALVITVLAIMSGMETGPLGHYVSGAIGFAILITAVIAVIRSKGRSGPEPPPETFHGTARFATPEEIAALSVPATGQALEPGSIILGFGGPGKLAVLPRGLAVQHGIIFGGSGTGKSRGYSMPNCASANNSSLVVTDPKNEQWNYTSAYHWRPKRYAPSEPNASECFNWIPLCGNARMAELCARAVMESGNKGNESQFYIDTEAAYLSALFAHTSTLAEPTPLTAYRLFTRQRPEQLLERLLNSQSEVAREQAIIFMQTDAKIRGSIVPAVAAKLQFMRDENVARFTSAEVEAPNFGKLRQEPTAVYWCLREQDIARLRPLTSLFFTVMLEQIANEAISEGSPNVPVTMLLDEFANIGTIPDFTATISLARGRGVGIWLFVQSLAQLEAGYGRANAQTILTNCATKVALHGLDVQTAKYVSEMLGDATIVAQRESFNDGGGFLSGGHASTTYSRTEHRRPLLTPDEVMRLDERWAIVRTGNRHPMMLAKLWYDEPAQTARAGNLGQARALELAPAQTTQERSKKLPDPPNLPNVVQGS